MEQVAAVTAPAPAPYNHSSALYDYIFGDGISGESGPGGESAES